MSEPLVLLVMVGVFAALALRFKLPLGVAIALAAVAGALAGGQGLALRHLVEGAFGFFDIILILASAMIFMKSLEESGALDGLVAAILRAFRKSRTGLLLTAMLLLMFPGMITGSSLAAVLSTGPLVAPVLLKLGLPQARTAAFVAMGAVLGMIAPPVNILVMIMGAGVDMPYVGLTLPLLIVSVPAAVFAALWIGRGHVRIPSPEELMDLIPAAPDRAGNSAGIKLYIPIFLVPALMIVQSLRLFGLPDLGLPAIFFIGGLAGAICGRRFNVLKATQKAVEQAMPILSILAGVGMFIQIMTLTGARGWAVLTFLSLPPALLFAGIAVGMPLFGGVSAFGSASVLGVPFLLALVNRNALITAAALSAIAGLGDLVPPAAMAARFSAQVAGERGLGPTLRACAVPALALLAWSLAVLLASPVLERIL
jgi:GntP family gluconate:H+ symporter